MGLPARKPQGRYVDVLNPTFKGRRSEKKFRDILSAAKKIFSNKGFYNTKVSEIAQEAQVASGTIYLYFKNKDDILIRMFEEEFRYICDRIEDSIADLTDPRDMLVKFCSEYLTIVCSDKYLAGLINGEMRQARKYIDNYQERSFQALLALLADIIDEGKDLGVFREDVDADIAARMTFGCLDETCIYMVGSISSRERKNHIALIGSLLLRGLMKRTGDFDSEPLALSRIAYLNSNLREHSNI